MFIRLTAAAATLMLLASGLGVFADTLYRDNALVKASWLGNDLVTLVIAAPMLIGSLRWAHRDSSRALLVTLGLLAYAVYNYAFYLFGAAFNALFLVYVAIVVSSTLGLIAGLTSEAVRSISITVQLGRASRIVGAMVVVISLGLGVFWTALSLNYLVSGEIPGMVTATDHPTNLTGALDLWLVVTFGLVGGVWLLRGSGWGYVISAIWTVKGAIYMAALCGATASAYWNGEVDSLAQLALWAPIGVACAVGAGVLLALAPARAA